MSDLRTIAAAPTGGPAHSVKFYDADTELLPELTAFIAGGLRSGGRAVVIATPEHRQALVPALAGAGVGLDEAAAEGRLWLADAAEMIDELLVDGELDPQRFDAAVGGLIREAGEGGTPVRAFGEMVSLLWDDGDVAAALELEALWNGLLAARDCSLLCAYPTLALDGISVTEADRICSLHEHVLPPGSYAKGGSPIPARLPASEVFLPVPTAVSAARHFVAAVLARWQLGDAVTDDALLVTSELATNSVAHAMSAFRISVGRAAGLVRILCEDITRDEPEMRGAVVDSPGGRGLLIVDRLAARWGCERAGDGKAVWAELALPS